jgi:hypothetical protein
MLFRRTLRLNLLLLPAILAAQNNAVTDAQAVSQAIAAAAAAAAPAGSTAGTATQAVVTAAVVNPVFPPKVITPAEVVPLTPFSAGETSLLLEINFGIRAVPPSRVTVPVGERVTILAPAISDGAAPIQWYKNGQPIAGATNRSLLLSSVQAADGGTYHAIFTDPVMAGRGSQSLVLAVGPVNRLLNLSTRATLGAGAGQSFLSGFVVAASASTSKKLIIRAVGPSLAAFNVSNPLRRPVLRIYDGSGKLYQNGYVYPAVVGGPTYDSDLADSLARCGAFPIPAGTEDAVLMMPFPPGNYLAEVSSGDLTAGMVLLEIYEVP